MRNNDNFNRWTDLGDHSFLRQPDTIVKAADIAYRQIVEEADLYCAGEPRRVLYEDDDGNKTFLELIPYVHPTGAGDFTFGTLTSNADGTRTYATTQEGRLLGEDGALINTNSSAIDIAGLPFADYWYYGKTDNMTDREHARAVKLGEGDLCWLVRNGPWELDSTTALTVGDDVVVSESVAGECEKATDMDTTTAITLAATMVEHFTRDAMPNLGQCIGRAAATSGGAGLCLVDIALGARRMR